MKEELFKLITCSDSESQELVEKFAEQYKCSVEKVYWTVRSIFGKKLRDLRWDFREPNREEFLKNVLTSGTKEELRARYPLLSAAQWVGVYDRTLGVSTFKRSKEQALIELMPVIYYPVLDNNVAMFAACRLGDGSFDSKRRAMKIEHCWWQQGWLEKKVEMFVKSFPQASDKIVHRSPDGRNTYVWYSRAVFGGKFYDLGTCPKQELVQHLNLFGLWYLFLDDGCYCNTQQQVVNYAVENIEIGTRLAEKLRGMGFPFRVANKNTIVLTGIEDIVKFFKTVLEPFRNLTPECMRYKIDYVKI